MADTRTRIINLPEATTLDPSMNFVEDSADGSGTRRVTYDTLKGAINQEVAVNLAPAYSNAATYNVGDLCTYQGTLYTCNTQISTAEDWTAAHWTLTNMASDLYQLKSEITDLGNRSILDIHVNFEDGKYVRADGVVGNNSAFALSEYVPIDCVYRIFSGVSHDYCIVFYDSTLSYLSSQGADGTQLAAQWIVLNAPANAAYMRFNTYKPATAIADTVVEYFNASILFNKKFLEIDTIGQSRTVPYEVAPTAGYINLAGNVVNAANFSRTEPFMLFAGERVEIVARGLLNYVSILSKYNGDTYIPLIATSADSILRYTYDIEETGLYACSYITNYGFELKAYTPINVVTNELQHLSENSEAIDANILAMYDNFICIGDSLTWSQVYTSASAQRRAFKTYPQILASLCDGTGYCFATPGDTAILWWSRSSAGAFDNHGIYIVFLGTNGGLTDTIDTDCVGSDPDQFDKTTNTGAYGAILQTIKNNGDKAVLVKPWAGGGSSLSVTNEVIDKFASKYDYPVISVPSYERENEYYHKFPDGTGLNGLHFNDVGYAWLANAIKEQINILSPADKFKIMRNQ